MTVNKGDTHSHSIAHDDYFPGENLSYCTAMLGSLDSSTREKEHARFIYVKDIECSVFLRLSQHTAPIIRNTTMRVKRTVTRNVNTTATAVSLPASMHQNVNIITDMRAWLMP